MTPRRRVGWRRTLHASLLAATLALAGALRLHGIARDSLWGDEALSVIIAKMPLTDLLRHVAWWEQIPPLHHLVLKVWMSIFGDREAAVRMPSALAGLAAVAMMYLLVRRLAGRGAALAAAVVLAVSPMHIAYAHECRAYALAFFLAVLSTDLFIRATRRPTLALQSAYVIVSALLLYAHIYGAFVLAAHNIAFLWRVVREARPLRTIQPWLAMNLAIAVLFAPMVPVVLRWLSAVNVTFWVKKAYWFDITRAYWVYSGSKPLLLLAAALFVLGVRCLWRRNSAALPLLLSLTFVPVVLPVMISVLTHPSFAPRYGMVACAGFFPIIGAGIASLWWPLRWVATIVVIALSLSAIDGEATKIPKAPWRDAMAYLDRTVPRGDVVVVHIKAGSRLYNYYNTRQDLRPRPFDSRTLPVGLPLNPGQHVWFLLYEEWYPLRSMLDRGPWHVIAHRRFGDILIMELEGDSASAAQRSAPNPAPTTLP